MHRNQLILWALGLALILTAASSCQGSLPATGNSPVPITTKDGRAWRIGYYEGGEYVNYAGRLRGVTHGLAALGWIEPVQFPANLAEDDAGSLWHYLSEYASSDYIQFVADAFWSAGWDDDRRQTNRETALAQLRAGDLDMVLAMGTWAGQDLAVTGHSVPTVVLSTSNPVEAGIIKSPQDSGLNQVTAAYDPYRYLSQMRLFHDIVAFKTIGVALEDSPDGRVYANLAELHQLEAETGVRVVECYIGEEGAGETKAVQEIKRCYTELAPQVDAVWIGAALGEQSRFMPDNLSPLLEYRVATWSQAGNEAVHRGVLLSISSYDNFDPEGLWVADHIARIFHGTKPRDLPQIFEPQPAIAINMETARRIGFVPPPGLLEAADVIYEDINGE